MIPGAGLFASGAEKLRAQREKLSKRIETARAEEARAVEAEAAARAAFAAALTDDPDADAKRFRADSEKASAAASSARAVVSALEEALTKTSAALAQAEEEEREARLFSAVVKSEAEARDAADELTKLLPKLAELVTRGAAADNRITSAIQALGPKFPAVRSVSRFDAQAIAGDYVESYARELHRDDITQPGRLPFPNLGQLTLSIPFDSGTTRAACNVETEPKS